MTLKARYADFQLITRSATGDKFVQTQEQILSILPELLKKTEIGKRSIRLIGVSLSGLSSIQDNSVEEEIAEYKQMGLFNVE